MNTPTPPSTAAPLAARLQRALDDAVAALQAQGEAVDTAARAAARHLLGRAAVALPRARQRQQALALAAVALHRAAGVSPVHLVASSDDAAAAAAAVMAPWFAACGGAAAHIEHTTLRRLAAAHSQAEQRLRGAGAAQVSRPAAAAVLLDDLDRLLADDGHGAITLAVADDSTGFVAAQTQVAALLRARPGLALDALSAQLEGQAAHLPPVWRGAERRLALLRQALLVQTLQPGRDYSLGDGGSVWFDDGLMARLPERELAAGLTQALQLHLGLPATPVARTVARLHADSLLAPCRWLGGTAPSLLGLGAELKARLHLDVHDSGVAAGPSPWPLQHLKDSSAAAHHIGHWLQDSAGPQRLLVLRRAAQWPRWAALLQTREPGTAPTAIVVDTPHSPQPLAAALARLRAGQPLDVLFAEPLESRRAEAAWRARLADFAAPAPVQGQQLLAPPLALLHEHLPLLARCLPAAAPAALHRTALQLARAVSAWRLSRQRCQQGERERRLAQQLSFTTGQRSALPPQPLSPSTPPPPSATTPIAGTDSHQPLAKATP